MTQGHHPKGVMTRKNYANRDAERAFTPAYSRDRMAWGCGRRVGG